MKIPLVCRIVFLFLSVFLSGSATALEIAADTVWEGTIVLQENVLVHPGTTLLLRPGTLVRLGGEDRSGDPLTLIVQGRLIAQGTPEAPIVFTSAADSPRPGDWGGILFEKESVRPSRLRHCRIEYARRALGGSAGRVLMEDSELRNNLLALAPRKQLQGGAFGCRIEGNETAVRYDQNSDFELAGCSIRHNRAEGILLLFNSSPRIRGCDIGPNGGDGVFCLQGSSPLLTDNVIAGNRRGVYTEMRSHPLLEHNEIRDNGTGVWAEKLVAPRLFFNRLVDNEVGIYCNFSAYPIMRGNTVEGNRLFAVVLGDNQSAAVDRLLPAAARYRVLEVEPPVLPAEPQERKSSPEPSGDFEKTVDARENWWGKEALQELQRKEGFGNISVFEDFHDKPETEYLGERYRRDRVVYDGWMSAEEPGVGVRRELFSGLRGKVSFRGKPLAGGRVHVFRDLSQGFAGEGFTFSAPTDSEGRYSLHLAPGRYMVTVKKTASPFPDAEIVPGDFFGYHGGNPVVLERGEVQELNLQAEFVEKFDRSASAESAAFIAGEVFGPQGRGEGAGIYLYPTPVNELRGPDLFGAGGAVPGGVDAEGRFEVEVPPGSYYLVAAKRPNGRLGPLQPGDLMGVFPGNPITLGAGERLSLTLRMTEKLRSDSPDPTPEGGSGIAGTLRDSSGRPLAGVYAFACTEPYPGGAIPPFRSRPTGADGSFFLPLADPGTYYLGGRSGYGGPPGPGEWTSFRGGDTDLRPVEFSGGGRTPVDLVLEQME